MKPKQLKKWREENNFTQAALAKVLGVKSNTVARWESAVNLIPSFLYLALAHVESLNKLKKKGGKSHV